MRLAIVGMRAGGLQGPVWSAPPTRGTGLTLLETVHVGRQSVQAYERDTRPGKFDALIALAEPLRGLRVLHVNATPYGGGVAEILRSEIPLLRDLGLIADWSIISGDDRFLTVTKTIHNGLQGAERTLDDSECAEYLKHGARNAALLEGDYDVIVVHDPQRLAIPAIRGCGNAKMGVALPHRHVGTESADVGVPAAVHALLRESARDEKIDEDLR